MNYQNKKILLMGLGGFKKGSGVSSAEFLASRGADLTITDLKNKKDLAQNLQALKKYKNITYVLGGHQEKDFTEADWVVRNPDVPPSSPFLIIARRCGVPIDNDITLFFREYGVGDVIGITGTRGKSTTTALTHAMMKEQFKNAKLGGNIGESPLRFLNSPLKVRGVRGVIAPIILELSNFQLSDLDTIKMSPHIAVWTNLYPDHLNKYPSIKEYEADKMKIFQYQKEGDAAILNWDNETTKKIGKKIEKRVKGRKVLFFSLKKKPRDGAYIKNSWFVFVDGGKETKICKTSETKLLGEHNLANTLAAICAAKSFGVNFFAIKKAIKTFVGVPNRLELVRIIKGVKFYNDCTATSPQATIAALKSFRAGKIILITGGNSKGSPLQEMGDLIAKRAKAVFLMPGKVNSDLKGAILNASHVILNEDRSAPSSVILSGARSAKSKNPLSIFNVATLKEAIKKSLDSAKKDDIILLSPGLTWLPRQNEFARGKEFKKIVKKI